MTTIRWLHISDLHLDAAMLGDGYDVNTVLRPLLNTVAARQSGPEPVDLIFLTGDIGNRGQARDYRVTVRFLDDLLAAAGLPKERLWLVPGNHDVDRDAGRMLVRTMDGAAMSLAFFSSASQRISHLRKFAAYTTFLGQYFPTRTLVPGDAVHEPAVLSVRGAKLGVLPLNSAWFSQDDDDQGKLWVGERPVRERAQRLRAAGAERIVALLHHPFSFFHEEESAKAWIRQECDIVLRGHLHRAEVENVESDSGVALEVAAGAAYQGSSWPCRAFFAVLDLDDGTLRLDPVRYARSPSAGTWVVDADVFPNEGANQYRKHYRLPPGPVATTIPAPPGRAQFPHSTWTAVNRAGWLSLIAGWFPGAYRADPDGTMRRVLEHAFEILCHAGDQRNLAESVVNLGIALRRHLPASLPPERSHHDAVLRLLELGVHRTISHLFMLPQVDLDDLLDVPDYSRLLLATRLLNSGHYEEAQAMAAEVGSGCCVALYVMGQSLRKLEFNYAAESKFALLSELLGRIGERGQTEYPCSATARLACMCSYGLLLASAERARAVVARRLEDYPAAEAHYEAATRASEEAIAGFGSRLAQPTQTEGRLTVPTSSHTPSRVLSDIQYSHGYYWYEKGEFDRAAELFTSSIKALESSPHDWDSPYTRLGIIRLLQGRTKEAVRLLLRARDICAQSPPGVHREAWLSLALCTLALKVLEAATGWKVIDTADDPLADLETALSMDPPLAPGPLLCHRHDAEQLLRVDAAGARDTIATFIARIAQAEGGAERRRHE
jgi:tetratricopeptide (TPR) repeat protein/predicted phosphodiesterase